MLMSALTLTHPRISARRLMLNAMVYANNLIHTSKKQLTLLSHNPSKGQQSATAAVENPRKSQQSATAAVESQLDCGNSKHNLSITLISCQ